MPHAVSIPQVLAQTEVLVPFASHRSKQRRCAHPEPVPQVLAQTDVLVRFSMQVS